MDLWEILEYVGETLVFLGVVGEVFAEWREPERKRLAKALSVILVVSLAASLAALIGTNEYFNGTIANLNLKASQANAASSKNEVEAARQRDRADEDEKELTELQKDSLPRAIDVARVASKLKGFAGTRFDIITMTEWEPGHTAALIRASLLKARWNAGGGAGGGMPDELSRSGIWVEAAAGPDWVNRPDGSRGPRSSEEITAVIARLKPAARALAVALQEEGLDAHTRPASKLGASIGTFSTMTRYTYL
jgi:hypothetical protein